MSASYLVLAPGMSGPEESQSCFTSRDGMSDVGLAVYRGGQTGTQAKSKKRKKKDFLLDFLGKVWDIRILSRFYAYLLHLLRI
jgi:hypothetical protein